MAEIRQAIALDPNYADNYLGLGIILGFAGQPEEAIKSIKTGMRLNPRYSGAYYPSNLGWAYRLAGRREEALAPLQEALTLAPNFLPTHVVLAGCYAELGWQEEAQAQAAEVLRLNPQFSMEAWGRMLPYKDPATLERMLASLRKAGLK